MISMIFKVIVAGLMLLSSCGTETDPPPGGELPMGGWPAPGQCAWEDLGQSGGCPKLVEYCTTKTGLHCTVFVICRQAYPQGCEK